MRTDDCSQQDRIAGCLLVIAASGDCVFRSWLQQARLPRPMRLSGFAIVAAAALASIRVSEKNEQLARPSLFLERGDDLLRAVVAGLPDPVVALDRGGRVLALNERARALAPALRQGEPVAFALAHA